MPLEQIYFPESTAKWNQETEFAFSNIMLCGYEHVHSQWGLSAKWHEPLWNTVESMTKVESAQVVFSKSPLATCLCPPEHGEEVQHFPCLFTSLQLMEHCQTEPSYTTYTEGKKGYME